MHLSLFPTEDIYPIEQSNVLGRRYATLPAGADKEQALLDLCRCFHPYLMKYVSMICRGHLPDWKGRVSQDTRSFIRYFLPKGSGGDRAAVLTAIRHLHLAFKTMETDEIYDVLMEQFLKAAAKFDPRYTEKLKQVVEVIEDALSDSRFFRAADVDRYLEFGGDRYLRLLCRRGFLVAEKRDGEKRTAYLRSGTWPPPAEFFNEPIGLTDGPSKGLPVLPLG